MITRYAIPAVAIAYSGIAVIMGLAIWVAPVARDRSGDSQVGFRKSYENEELKVAELAGPIAERPLFHVSRRAYAEPEAAVVVQEAPTLRLLGILNSNETRIALLRFSNVETVFRVQKNDNVGEWTVLDITDGWVDLSDGNGPLVRLVFDTGQ